VQVDYDKIAIDYCWSSRASSPDVTLRPSPPPSTQIHSKTHAWTATHQWISRLSQMRLQKCSKVQHILLIMDSRGGYRPWLPS